MTHASGLRSRLAADEHGFGLVELLVVMSIMVIVGAVITTGIVSGLRANERGQRRVEALTDLERAAERIARDLRFADPVRDASANAVNVTVLRRDGGDLVTHEVDYLAAAGVLEEQRTVYEPDGSVTGPTTTTIIDGLDPDEDVFTFRSWTSGAPSDITEIDITLVRELEGQDPIEVETAVMVRNVADGL